MRWPSLLRILVSGGSNCESGSIVVIIHGRTPELEDDVACEDSLNRAKLAELMVTQSEAEAQIVKGILEEAGIYCTLLTQVPHSLYPLTIDGLAAISIKVLDTQLEAARALLKGYTESSEPLSEEDPEEVR